MFWPMRHLSTLVNQIRPFGKDVRFLICSASTITTVQRTGTEFVHCDHMDLRQ